MGRQMRAQCLTTAPERGSVALDTRHQTPKLTSAEAIAFLGLHSTGALYHHIRENRLPTLRVGRSYRFDRAELQAWLQGQGSLDLRLVPRKARG